MIKVTYDFDEYSQSDEVMMEFVEGGEHHIVLTDDKSDSNGVHLSCNNGGITVTKMTRDAYDEALEEGLIVEDKWPDFSIEVFISNHKLHECYSLHQAGQLTQDDFFDE